MHASLECNQWHNFFCTSKADFGVDIDYLEVPEPTFFFFASMSSYCKRILGFGLQLKMTRYLVPYIGSSFSLFPFSTLDIQSNYLHNEPSVSLSGNQHILDESYVIAELSDLLQVSPKTSISNLYKDFKPETQVERRSVDAFLLPEEKLRGVFLQKLKGKTAIEKALTNTGVELSLDVVFKVVSRESLSGESIVVFFNWAIKQPSICEDIHCYNLVLKALGRRKYFKFMVELLHEMGTQGRKPTLESISIVLDSFIRANHINKAVQIFRNLKEVGLECDTETLNVLLQCFCRRSHVGAANSFFNSMNGRIQFDATTYNIIIGGWSRFGKVEQIERILKAMVAAGHSPNCLTFSYLIEGLGRAGRIDDAVRIFDHMKEEGHVPDTRVYNTLIFNFVSVRNFDECRRYYETMLNDKCEPDLDTYTKLICAFLKVRKVADALEMFEEMLSRGIVPTTGAATSFIEPLCNYGPPHAAIVVYKKARKVGCRISLGAYKLLLMRLSRFGKCGMLLNLWDEMQESGYSCDREVYEYVINGLCNIGHLENAVLVMEECLQKGFCPSRLICSKLNNKLLASHKVEVAYKLYLKIKDARRYENARRYWRANGWHF